MFFSCYCTHPFQLPWIQISKKTFLARGNLKIWIKCNPFSCGLLIKLFFEKNEMIKNNFKLSQKRQDRSNWPNSTYVSVTIFSNQVIVSILKGAQWIIL